MNRLVVIIAWLRQRLITAATHPPHLVLILAEDLGWVDVTCLNPDSKIPTPSLDRLAMSKLAISPSASAPACEPFRGAAAWRRI